MQNLLESMHQNHLETTAFPAAEKVTPVDRTRQNSQRCHTEADSEVWGLGRHIPQLDGVRGMAILMVTLWRFTKDIPVDHWLGKCLHTCLAIGDRGVDLFFVLSGFLITGVLLESRAKPSCFRNFFIRRSLRIFPLYFAALLLFLIAIPRFPPLAATFDQARGQEFYLWTYLVNLKMSLCGKWCFGYLDHFWSLAVEEHFYLLWPLVIFILPGRAIAWVASGLMVVAASSRILFSVVSENGVAPDVFSFFRFDALLIGALLAHAIRQPSGVAWLRRPLLATCLLALPVCIASLVLEKRWFTVAHSLWPLVWGTLLVWLLTSRVDQLLGRLFASPSLRKLGKYSYAMYVFQSPLIPLTASIWSVALLKPYTLNNGLFAAAVYATGMFGLTYAIAVFSWFTLERPCLRCKDRWTRRAAQPLAPTSPLMGNAVVASH